MNAQHRHQTGTGNPTSNPPTNFPNPTKTTCQLALWLLTLAGSLHLARADTFVSGNVSGTWTKMGSRYILVGNCTVPSGQSLTIQPGVTVVIGQGLGINVEGQILAIGTAAERITIQGANSSLYWDKVLINYTGPAQSSFVNCDISGATNAVYLNVYQVSATMAPRISGCVFSNCMGACVYGSASAAGSIYGVVQANLNPIIANCYFQNSTSGIVFCISGNRPSGAYPGQGTASPLIANNVFNAITGPGITFQMDPVAYAPAASNPKTVNSVFQQCGVSVQRNVDLTSFSDEVSYNCFYNNQTNFVGYPSGVYGTICCVNPNGTPCDLVNNIFTDPLFAQPVTYTLATNSPCIDAGNPAAAYLDGCFPPSQGTTVNDIGIYGGPNACGWLTNEVKSFSLTAQEYVGVTITPSAAGRYRLEYINSLVNPPATNGPWIQATNLMLLSTPYTYIDFSSPTTGKRFYRALLLP